MEKHRFRGRKKKEEGAWYVDTIYTLVRRKDDSKWGWRVKAERKTRVEYIERRKEWER